MRFRRARDGIARLFHIRQQRDNARGHVEANGITGPARCAWIIRQQNRDAPFSPRLRLQRDQRRNSVGQDCDPIRLRQTAQCGETKILLRRQRPLESDHAL